MNTKRTFSLAVLVLCAASVIFAGGQQDSAKKAVEMKDGIYFAQEDSFSESSGWKYMVTLEVKDGKIAMAEWNGAHIDDGTDKITRSKSGEYGMVEKGGAIAPWWEQAQKAEEYLLKTQDPTDINYTNDAGNTDDISGVTIHVREFFTLAQKALEKGPVGYGQYKDGHYHAEQAEFSENGWKTVVDLTVVSGYIVAANWTAIPEEGGDDKETQSINGKYGMVENGGAQAPWYKQARATEAYLLKTQDPTKINYTDDAGSTDAISGVSIHVKEFFVLAQEALQGAKR